MTRKRARPPKEGKQFGKRPPQYRFNLNPYPDVRFSKCPGCEGKMGQRKLPLVIVVKPDFLVALNKTCKYCPRCDILIAHQDDLEALLSQMVPGKERWSEDDYLILGTLDRADWKRGQEEPLQLAELPEYLHDFREYLTVQVWGGWQPAGARPPWETEKSKRR